MLETGVRLKQVAAWLTGRFVVPCQLRHAQVRFTLDSSHDARGTETNHVGA